jgi:hypothetical protein
MDVVFPLVLYKFLEKLLFISWYSTTMLPCGARLLTTPSQSLHLTIIGVKSIHGVANARPESVTCGRRLRLGRRREIKVLEEQNLK